MNKTKILSLIALVILGIYGGLFLNSEIPQIPQAGSRWQFIISLILSPDWLINGLFLSNSDYNPPTLAFFEQWEESAIPLNRLTILLFVLLESAWIYVLGRSTTEFLLPSAAWKELHSVERFCFSCAVGAAIVSAFTALMGLLQLLNPAVFWTALLLATTIFGGKILYEALYLPKKLISTSEKILSSEKTPVRWLIIAAGFVLLTLLAAMLPPWEFDVREYHLQAVKEFYLAGQIQALPHNAYANMPLGAESLTLAAMTLTGNWFLGALVGKTLLALFLPLTGLLLWSAGTRFMESNKSGIIAALVYLSLPLIVHNAQLGLIDFVLAFYTFAAGYSLMLAREKPELKTGLWILAGITVGMAAAIKYTAVVFVGLPAAIIVLIESYYSYSEDNHSGENEGRVIFSVIESVLIFMLISLLTGGIWYLKNAMLFGNPVYPLLSWIGGKTAVIGFSPESIQAWHSVHISECRSIQAAANVLTQFFFRSFELSPLFVPLAGISLLFLNRLSRFSKYTLIYICVFIIIWIAATHNIERFLIPCYPFIAILAGETYVLICDWAGKTGRRVCQIFLSVSLIYSVMVLCIPLPGGMWGVGSSIAANRAVDVRLGNSLSSLINSQPELLRTIKKSGEKIWLLGDAAVFDWPIPIQYAVCFNSQEQIDCLKSKLADRKTIPPLIVINLNEIARYRSTGYGYSREFSMDIFKNALQSGWLEVAYSEKGIVILKRTEKESL